MAFRNADMPAMLWAIFAVCVVVELCLAGSDFGLWGTGRWRSLAYQNGGFWIGLLGSWRPNYPLQAVFMFATYAFLHNGIMHLAVNMLTLFVLGRVVVERIGQIRFFSLYILAMVGGGAGFALLSDVPQPMVGASGALFGLAGAIAAWEYVDRTAAEERLWPVFRLVLLLLLLNLVLWWAMDGQLAWETHFGGFVSGWVIAFLVDPRSRSIEN